VLKGSPRDGRHRHRHPQAAAKDAKASDLGLVIIDEEHRFGVRQKEQLKALRAEVDVLTLTATPIPRTLNMAMAGCATCRSSPPRRAAPGHQDLRRRETPPLIREAMPARAGAAARSTSCTTR
jgi:transcription-repair coupling factor (superfamily II helicase)